MRVSTVLEHLALNQIQDLVKGGIGSVSSCSIPFRAALDHFHAISACLTNKNKRREMFDNMHRIISTPPATTGCDRGNERLGGLCEYYRSFAHPQILSPALSYHVKTNESFLMEIHVRNLALAFCT